MAKQTLAFILLVLIAANGALGWFLPRLGVWANGGLVAVAIGLIVVAWVMGRRASMDSSEGFTALFMLIAGAVGLVFGAAGLGWALWVVNR